MVGILGGGLSHLRLPDGRHIVIDNLSTAPAAAHGDMYRADPVTVLRARATPRTARTSSAPPRSRHPARSPAGPTCWQRYGTRAAASGARACDPPRRATASRRPTICMSAPGALAADLARDPGLAALFLPGGAAIAAGATLVQTDYATTLRRIADDGPAALHGGALGQRVADHIGAHGGTLSLRDLASYKPLERETIRGSLSRPHHRRPAAARLERRPYRPDAQHPRRVRRRRHGLRHARRDPSAGRGAQDRLRGPRGRDRRSGLRRCAGRAPDLEVLCGRAPRADRHGPHTALAGRARRPEGVGRHHARHGRRCRRPRGRRDPHHQQPVRRLRADSRHRHDRQQLHVQLRSASGPRAVDRAGQARLHLDGADDGGRGRPRAPCARPARRPAHLPVRVPGDRQPDRSRA